MKDWTHEIADAFARPRLSRLKRKTWKEAQCL